MLAIAASWAPCSYYSRGGSFPGRRKNHPTSGRPASGCGCRGDRPDRAVRRSEGRLPVALREAKGDSVGLQYIAGPSGYTLTGENGGVSLT